MDYTEDALEAFIVKAIGGRAVERFRPKIDRLITLYVQYNVLRNWLDDYIIAAGSKEYKENLTILNGLMQNVRNLEDDIELYSVKEVVDGSNAVLDMLGGKK